VKLEELVVADNNLRVLPASLAKLTRLQRLDLSRNKLENAESDDGGGGESASASVSGSGEGAASVSGSSGEGPSTSTSSSDDAAAAADAAGLRHVGGCISLIELRLEGNVGLRALPRALGTLASLKILSADNTSVRRVHGAVLEGCKALHTLSVHGGAVQVESS
jgi:Leucine-rich repeat (LRR) protein